MEVNFKKIFILLGVFVGLCYYVSSHYGPEDALKYANTHPDFFMGPAVDYYVGMGYYMRSDYGHAIPAFNQLLTDYTTCQYTPNALLRLGASSEELFHWQDAKNAYQQYMDRFPEGPDLSLVQKKYDQIKFK